MLMLICEQIRCRVNKEYEYANEEGIECSNFVNREVVGFQLRIEA